MSNMFQDRLINNNINYSVINIDEEKRPNLFFNNSNQQPTLYYNMYGIKQTKNNMYQQNPFIFLDDTTYEPIETEDDIIPPWDNNYDRIRMKYKEAIMKETIMKEELEKKRIIEIENIVRKELEVKIRKEIEEEEKKKRKEEYIKSEEYIRSLISQESIDLNLNLNNDKKKHEEKERIEKEKKKKDEEELIASLKLIEEIRLEERLYNKVYEKLNNDSSNNKSTKCNNCHGDKHPDYGCQNKDCFTNEQIKQCYINRIKAIY